MIDKTKYKNKYRIASTRLQKWDYGWNGAYFITICTQNRIHYLGEVIDNQMQLSHIGVLSDVFLNEIKNHTNNIKLGAYAVMPNHVHVILILNNDVLNNGNDVETLHATSLQQPQQPQPNATSHRPHDKIMADISPKHGTISTIIRSYKSAVTKHAHRLGYEFSWQPRFYDHIIRNEKSFNKISEYINTNPQKWKDDRFYQES